MKNLLLLICIVFIFNGCVDNVEPTLNTLKLVLKADRTIGTAPFTVKFSAKIEGNIEGLSGHVPDYIFYPDIGGTVIRYMIPDTSQSVMINWSSEQIYPSGDYKVVLLYQGIKEGSDLDLFSDTLRINVN